MTIIDMHPDDLLDRELSGTLSASEQRRLAEHLSQCPGCRLERQLRDDFSHELVASRAPDMLQTFVSGALRAALPANGTTPLAMQTPALPAPVVTPARRAKRRRAALLGVAVVIASAVAAAQIGLIEQVAGFAREQLTKVTDDPTPKAPAAAPHDAPLQGQVAANEEATRVAHDTFGDRTVPSPSEHAPSEREVAPALDEDESAPARAREGKKERVARSKKARASERQGRARRSDRVAEAPASSSVAAASPIDLPASDTSATEIDSTSVSSASVSSASVARAGKRSVRARREVESPSLLETATYAPKVLHPEAANRVDDEGKPAIASAVSLFHRANSARREGLSSEALHAYERLRAEFPTSAEARLSLVLAARMHLDSGRLGDAVAGFDSYIATRDRSLREQALAGRAIALGRLGRTREELAAWQSLLLDYPDSSYAAVASQRLRQDQR